MFGKRTLVNSLENFFFYYNTNHIVSKTPGKITQSFGVSRTVKKNTEGKFSFRRRSLKPETTIHDQHQKESYFNTRTTSTPLRLSPFCVPYTREYSQFHSLKCTDPKQRWSEVRDFSGKTIYTNDLPDRDKVSLERLYPCSLTFSTTLQPSRSKSTSVVSTTLNFPVILFVGKDS